MKRILLLVLVLCLLMGSCFVGCTDEHSDNADEIIWQDENETNNKNNTFNENEIDDDEEVNVETETEEINYSEGLQFVLSEDRTYMVLAGRGSCQDRKIIIPPTYKGMPVKEIKDRAFAATLYDSTPNIREVIIPNSVVSIGDNAFRNCEYISKIHIGDSVEKMGECVFRNCAEPLDISVESLESFLNIDLDINGFFGGGTHEYNLYFRGQLVKELTIPDTVKQIEDSAFSGCISIEKLTLGKSVVSIGYNAFSDCKNLTDVNFNSSLKSIKLGAFNQCNLLMKANFKNTKKWTVTKSTTTTSDSQSLSSSDLSNPNTAAKYLSDDYSWHNWERG